MTRFFILFLIILVALFAAELTPPVQSALVLPWTEALAHISAAIVTLFDARVVAYGKILQSTASGFAVSIEAGCNGIEAAIILIAAMLAFHRRRTRSGALALALAPLYLAWRSLQSYFAFVPLLALISDADFAPSTDDESDLIRSTQRHPTSDPDVIRSTEHESPSEVHP